MKRYFIHLIFGGFLLIQSCTEEKQGIVDVAQNPPKLLTATIQPAGVNVDTDTVNVVPLGGGSYRITAFLAAQASDVDGIGDIDNLTYAVYSPRSTTALASGAIARSSSSGDTAAYSSPITFVTTRADAGGHPIELSVRDRAGLVSNVLRQHLIVSRSNSAPQLSNLVAPDSVRRPTTGIVVILFSVAVSDSDGYGDIADVFFQQVSPTPSSPITMFDDGNVEAYGDQVAGDGVFSRLAQIDSSNSLGPRTLLFLARDRFGAFSDSLLHTMTIIP